MKTKKTKSSKKSKPVQKELFQNMKKCANCDKEVELDKMFQDMYCSLECQMYLPF